MAAGFTNGSAGAERLSALVDGETDAAASDAACASWRADAEARRTWHAWQLIGDVLRSEDLATSPAGDRRFLVALRARLASEPVVLAPAALPRPAESPDAPRRASSPRPVAGRWMLPSAVAAGFVLVIGTFAVLRQPDSPANPPTAVAEAASPLREVAVQEPALPMSVVAVNGRLIRDARLDRYLAAHKQFAGTSALGVPSTFLRSATLDIEPR